MRRCGRKRALPVTALDVLGHAALAALKATAEAIKEQHGALDVAWGEMTRVRAKGLDLPVSAGSGGLGAFRVGWFNREEDGSSTVVGGTTFVAAVEFGDAMGAQAILP